MSFMTINPQMSVLHRTLKFNKSLHSLQVWASVEPLGKLTLLFAVEHELPGKHKLVAAGIGLDTAFVDNSIFSKLQQGWGFAMVVKLFGMYSMEMNTAVQGNTALEYLYAAVTAMGRWTQGNLLAPCSHPAENTEITKYIGGRLEINSLGHGYLGNSPLYHAAGTRKRTLGHSGAAALWSVTNIDVARTLLGTDLMPRTSVLACDFQDIELLVERGVDSDDKDDYGDANSACR
ncbi:hypothetical protein K438DRAFT_1932254 [Mycena galopus ATCC 62051]|nr:hypothetical protein K438DRAFT_1932254 [Mycena galopus ATCC 62051]